MVDELGIDGMIDQLGTFAVNWRTICISPWLWAISTFRRAVGLPHPVSTIRRTQEVEWPMHRACAGGGSLMHPVEVGEERSGDKLVLSLVGKVNSANAHAFESAMMDRISGGEEHLVVDFSRLDFITSAGVRVFLLAAKALRAVNGTLVLCAMKEHVEEVFRISGCDRIIQIEESRRAALGSG